MLENHMNMTKWLRLSKETLHIPPGYKATCTWSTQRVVRKVPQLKGVAMQRPWSLRTLHRWCIGLSCSVCHQSWVRGQKILMNWCTVWSMSWCGRSWRQGLCCGCSVSVYVKRRNGIFQSFHLYSGTLNLQDSNENISHSTVMEQAPIICHTSRCSSKIIRAGKKDVTRRHTLKSVISLLSTGNNVTDTPLTGNSYNIYKQDISEIDMYTHLPRWINYIESLLGQQLGPDEYIFPYFRPNSIPDMSQEMTQEMVQSLINTFTSEAGLSKYFTTHCFQRGGAQYRFMYAPIGQRWSLCKIWWWGGCADGKHVSTCWVVISSQGNWFWTRATGRHVGQVPCWLTAELWNWL